MSGAAATWRMGAALPLLAALTAFVAAPRASADESRKKQQIQFAELPARTVDDAPFTLTAKATSGLPVAFEIVSGPAALDGKSLRLTGQPGLVIVRAAQEGNVAYLPALPAERAFPVNRRPAAPEILAQPAETRASIGAIAVLSVLARGEPAPSFQWRKDGEPVTGATDARLTIGSVSPSDAGDYDVVASNALGSVTSRRARVTVGKHSQTINFQASATPVGPSLLLTANASSGLPVRFDVVSGTATLNGALLTPHGGPIVVQASQAGDATYDPATPVAQRF